MTRQGWWVVALSSLASLQAYAQPRAPVNLMSGNGQCLSVRPEELGRDGGHVTTWECNGQPNQQWREHRGALVNAQGKCLDVNGPESNRNGATVQVWACNGQPNQQWRVERGLLVSGVGRCLDVDGPEFDAGRRGARVQTWDCHGRANQHWSLSPVAAVEPPPPPAPPPPPPPVAGYPRGTGHLRNGAQGLCLDVHGWAARGDSITTLGECNNDPDQVWSFSPTGELVNAVGQRCLDVAGYNGAQGDAIDIYACEAMDDQRWNLVPRGGGSFELHSRKRNLCLDVAGQDGGRGEKMMLWACDGGRDQVWRWEPIGHPHEVVYEQPVPPPPPPPAEIRPMHHERFQELIAAVNNQGFSQGKLGVIQQAAATNYFRVAQLRELVLALSFSGDRIRAVELVAPRIVDRENAFTLYDAFSFSSEKERARKILEAAP